MTISGFQNNHPEAQTSKQNNHKQQASANDSGQSQAGAGLNAGRQRLSLLGFCGVAALSLSLAALAPATATKLNAKPLPHAGAADNAKGTDADVNEYGRPIKDFSHGQESAPPSTLWQTHRLTPAEKAAKDKEEAEAKAKANEEAARKAQQDRINAIKSIQQIAIDSNNKAIALGKQGKLSEAIAEHELALKYDPSNKQFKINLSAAQTLYGQKLLASKDFAGASNMFRKALVAMPDNGQAGKYLAEAIQRMGLDPADASNRLGLGDQLAAAGDMSGANVEYQQAMRLDPGARTYTKMGDMAARYGQIANAVQWYRSAVVKDPNYAPAHRQLGNMMMAAKDMTQAASELRKAVILDPKDVAAGQGLIDIWRRQVATNPGLAENHIGLGTAMQLTGDISTAESEYAQAEKLDPRNAALPGARASLQRAVKHLAAEKHRDAAATFFNQGLSRDALAEISQAVMIEPHNDKYQFILGQCLENGGDFEGARQAFHTCVLLDPKNVEAAQHLKSVENSLAGRPAPAPSLTRPDFGGSQAGQQNQSVGIGSRQAGPQGSGPGGAAAGQYKNMYDGQNAGGGAQYQTGNGGGGNMAGQSQHFPVQVGDFGGQQSQYGGQQSQYGGQQSQYAKQQARGAGQSAQAGGQAGRPAAAAAQSQTIDPATQATLTAAQNMENQRDYQGAANLLKQALGTNLQNPNIHHQLAVNLLNLGQLEEAVSEFRIASALSPGNKIFTEDYARALKIHKKALAADEAETSGGGQATGAVGDLK